MRTICNNLDIIFNKIVNDKVDIYDINKHNCILSQMEYDYKYANMNDIINDSIIFKNEDFPAPLRPIRPTLSPSSREKEVFAKRSTCPYAS